MKLEQILESASELTKDDVMNMSEDDLYNKLNAITLNKSKQKDLIQNVTGFRGGKLGRGTTPTQLIDHVKDGSTKHNYGFSATMGSMTEYKCKVCGAKKKTKAA